MRESTHKVLVISGRAMKASGYDVLGILLTVRRSWMFACRCADGHGRPRVMLKASALQEYVLTCHTLRNLTCREFLSYVDAQCHEHGADVSR